jgi:hypothetical protein
MHIERRESPRIPANFYAEIRHQNQSQRWFINDLSQSGAYLERVSDGGPPPHGHLELSIQIPGQAEALHIQAETVYECTDALFSGSALRFRGMSSSHRGILHSWLQSTQREVQLPFPEVVPAGFGIHIFRPPPTSSDC